MNKCNRQFALPKKYVQAFHRTIRWTIIRFIHKGKKTTKEICDHLIKNGERPTPSGLYYHLSELKNADIIEVAEYNEEDREAPEKIWRLKTKKIIDLLEGKIYLDKTQKEVGL